MQEFSPEVGSNSLASGLAVKSEVLAAKPCLPSWILQKKRR
jgi:hypothetical protein